MDQIHSNWTTLLTIDLDLMEAWRRLSIELFPEYEGKYLNTDSIYSVLSDLEDMAYEGHRQNNEDDLVRIYKFTEWCYSQKDNDPDIWEAVSITFYKHLLDSDLKLWAIPYWVKPDTFREMRDENEIRMWLERRGAEFSRLLDLCDEVNGTDLE